MVKKQQSYNSAVWRVLALARMILGFTFLWAFFDKMFGFGLSTASGAAWINGVSPTQGFLLHGVNADSPLASFFHGLAGNVFVDWLFMLGLLGIGLALMLGVGLRIAAVTGTILLVMMWAAESPVATNPFVDEHLVYAIMLWVFALGYPAWSLNGWWLKHKYVKKHSWLW